MQPVQKNGYTANKCKRTGCDYEKDKTIIAATGHSSVFTEKITKQATCTEEGVKTYTCKNDCGYSYTESIPATGHSNKFDKYTTTQATCTTEGVTTYICKNGCGYSYKEPISAIGHKYKTITTQATCTTDGGTYEVCENCGSKTGTTTTPAMGHNWRNWETTTTPTCTRAEIQKHSCTVCGFDETQVLGALGHDYVETRTSYGAIGDTGRHTYNLTCTRCSKISYENEKCSFNLVGKCKLCGNWRYDD